MGTRVRVMAPLLAVACDPIGLSLSFDPETVAEVAGAVSTSGTEAPCVTLMVDATDNPVVLTAEAGHRDVAAVRYVADDAWLLGRSTDVAAGFEIQYTFLTTGRRSITAIAEDASGADIATHTLAVDVPGGAARSGAWLWYIEGTGLSHAQLAADLVQLGFGRIYVKVADGSADCGFWPELCDTSVVQTYRDAGLEVWGWSYNYPGSVTAQADAL